MSIWPFIESTIGDMLARYPRQSLYVIPPPNLEQLAAVELLPIPSVAGLVLRLPNEDLDRQFPGRIGWFEGTSSVRPPATPATTLLSILDWPLPSDELAASLLSAGVRTLTNRPAGQKKSVSHDLAQLPPYRAATVYNPISPTDITPQAEAYWRDIVPYTEDYWRWSLAPLAPIRESARASDRTFMCLPTLGGGGSERQAVYTARELHKRAHNVSVHVSRNVIHEPYLEMLVDGGVPFSIEPPFSLSRTPISLLPLMNALNERNCLSDDNVIDVLRFASLFIKKRPRVVHSWLDWSNTTAGLAAALTGTPHVVMSGRSMNPEWFDLHQPFMRPAYKMALATRGAVMINNSAAGAADYERWLGAGKPAAVIRNAFDPAEIRRLSDVGAVRQRHGIPLEAPVVCGLMRLSEEKRPLLWVKIAALVGKIRPDCHFVLAGDGAMAQSVADEVAASGIAAQCHLIGVRANPGDVLAIASCLLLTSRMEGLPNVLIEAQALGAPVVTSAVGGAVETFEEGVTGFAVAGDEPLPYAEAILRILDDRVWAERARDRGPALVRERFSMNRMIDETLSVYRQTP